VGKEDEERQADNDQDYKTQEHIGAPRMFGLANVGALLVPSHIRTVALNLYANTTFGPVVEKIVAPMAKEGERPKPGSTP
jgi:hypothetical protein